MTRTAVRRRVDLNDGRLVIRKIVVETSDCMPIAPAAEPDAEQPLSTTTINGRPGRLRNLKPGKYVVRRRETHII